MKFLIYIFIFIIIFSTFTFSQNSSSYTRYGIGDINYTYSARSLGLGQSGAATLSSNYIESVNPASWSALNLTRIEFSLVLNGVSLSDNTNSAFYTDTDFRGFTFAFPVSEKYGIGVASGLIPYSRISYTAVQMYNGVEPVNIDYTSTYNGSGGLSKLFIGASYKTPFDWIIGATAEYIFGKQSYFSKIEYNDQSYYTSEFELTYRSTGFGSTIGIISPNFSDLLDNENITNLRFGASLNLISELNTDTSLTINPATTADTVVSSNTKMQLPFRLTGGVSLRLKDVYTFNLDYTYQPWTEFKLNGKTSPYLRDVHKFSFGFEYIPKWKISSSVWELISWRAGLSYELSQYRINGYDIKQYSVFAGLSFPVGIGNSLDLGLEYSIRGTKDFDLIKENFYRINFGISFGDLWFQRFEK